MLTRSAIARHALLLAVLLSALFGCRSAPLASTAGKPHAECLVCKKNADLACVDLVVDDQTPRAEYQGKTYDFCSSDCRVEFLKRPDRYIEK